MKFIAVLASLALSLGVLAQTAAVDATCPVVFGYTGFANPSQWESISSQCGESEQSPVRFTNNDITPGPGGPITVHWGTVPINIQNSGYDFRINVGGSAHRISIGGKDYVLQNFHFHRTAEHLIQGRPTGAEVHFVHMSSDGEIAVIAMFFQEHTTATSPVWRNVFDALPVDLCDVRTTGNSINLDAVFGSPQTPRTLKTYHWYEGSLTTPPCAGDVKFYFANVAFQISAAHARNLATFGNNVRPLMPLEGRKLYAVNVP